MMTVLIIEDEPQAAMRLENLITKLEPGVMVLSKIDTVSRAVQWINSNPAVDLIFLDIQLADGISFLIFDQCIVESPIIFTTAYDEYALQAFKVNSIDYILKPVDPDELHAALKKYHSLRRTGVDSGKIMESIGKAVQLLTRKYKTRFMVKVGEHLRSVEVSEILFFYSFEKATFAQTREGRQHILDFSLDILEGMLDPDRFFRVNRKYIISAEALQDMISFTNSRIRLVLRTSGDSDIIVARERVQEFKAWLDR